MIQKTLHYIWLGGNKPDSIKRCIDSFHRYLKDYEIIEWNESNIDLNWFNETLKEFYVYHYSKGNFAFCADVARLYILEKFGGIYADADVEFVSAMPDFILHSQFISRNRRAGHVVTGLLWGVYKNDRLINALIRWLTNHVRLIGDSYGKKWILNDIIDKFFVLFGNKIQNDHVVQFHDYTIYTADYFGLSSAGSKSIAISHYNNSWK